jgi:hypothetical protein
MLIIVPAHRANEVLEGERYIRLKYAFLGEEPRQRIRTLTTAIMNELAMTHPGEAVGWKEYERSDARQLVESDEALFEAAQLISDLTHVDGAVMVGDPNFVSRITFRPRGPSVTLTALAQAVDPAENPLP